MASWKITISTRKRRKYIFIHACFFHCHGNLHLFQFIHCSTFPALNFSSSDLPDKFSSIPWMVKGLSLAMLKQTVSQSRLHQPIWESNRGHYTVDGRNPANQLRLVVYLPLFTGFYTSQVVQDFFHQQYYHPKQGTIRGKFPQNLHIFALFDPPKIGNLLIPV